MPLSPPLVLEAGNDTKFQLLPLFNIVGPLLGLTRNLGARQSNKQTKERHYDMTLWFNPKKDVDLFCSYTSMNYH